LLGKVEPILTAGGRAMGDDTEISVGIDVATVRNAIAIADGERGALSGRGKKATIGTAIARELVGFMWSVARQAQSN
jgi:hypothetical protein